MFFCFSSDNEFEYTNMRALMHILLVLFTHYAKCTPNAQLLYFLWPRMHVSSTSIFDARLVLFIFQNCDAIVHASKPYITEHNQDKML